MVSVFQVLKELGYIVHLCDQQNGSQVFEIAGYTYDPTYGRL
jgi:hypothetical protein